MENEKKKKSLPPFVMLCLIAVVMAFAIAKVYDMTKDTIAAAAVASQAAARQAVMEDAADMTELTLEDDSSVDYMYEAYDASGNVIGYVSQITVIGFGGEIEITVGMDTDAVITGISVGGSNFSETSGLGAKTKEPAFTDQFTGKSGVLVLKQDIDSVTGASISSGAVVSGVNQAVSAMSAMLGDGVGAAVEELELTDADLQTVLPGASEAEWMGAASGIDGWWQADIGYVVRASGFGEGLITITMGFDENGVCTGIIIGDENFTETEGRGALVQEEDYWGQFIGLSGEQSYDAGIDAISGATVTSDATLSAINACMTFDPSNFVALTAEEAASQEAALQAEAADAETEASVTEEGSSSEAASEEADAETEASVTEEEEAVAEPAASEEPAEAVDAETSSSIPEEEEVSEPAASVEPTASEEPAATEEPAETVDAETSSSIPEEEEVSEPAASVEPTASEEPAATEEPAETVDAETSSSIPEEEEASETVAAEEPAASEEPTASEEPAATEEPAEAVDAETSSSIPEEEETSEPAASEEPAASAEAVAGEEPAASEEPVVESPELDLQSAWPGAESAEWMGEAEGIDGWWTTPDGYIVRVTSDGENPVVVTVGFDLTGTVVGIYAEPAEGANSSVEIPDEYLAQFIGLSGEQSYDNGLDAISGASLTSDWMMEAINACMTFDSGLVTETVDAETSSSIPEE